MDEITNEGLSASFLGISVPELRKQRAEKAAAHWEKQKQLILQKRKEGLLMATIADQLNISLSTVVRVVALAEKKKKRRLV